MTVFTAYFGGTALLGLAAFLIRGTSPFSSAGCREYIDRQKRRTVGQCILIAALLLLSITLLSQLVSAGP